MFLLLQMLRLTNQYEDIFLFPIGEYCYLLSAKLQFCLNEGLKKGSHPWLNLTNQNVECPTMLLQIVIYRAGWNSHPSHIFCELSVCLSFSWFFLKKTYEMNTTNDYFRNVVTSPFFFRTIPALHSENRKLWMDKVHFQWYISRHVIS